MNKVKPWQLVVIVLGLLVGAGSLAYSFMSQGEVVLADTMYLLDVENGDLYSVDISRKGMAVPALHPETKRSTLIRIDRLPDGTFEVSSRDLQTIPLLDPKAKIEAFDTETGKLKHPAGKIKTYVRPSK